MTKRVLLAVLAILLTSVAAPAAAMGLDVANDDRDADLYIEQPHYASGDVGVDTSGNYTTYSVSGEEHRIKPRNFADKNVIDYGVEEQQADLRYNPELDHYVFDPSADGTYHVYFVVQTQKQVEVAANETNSTNSTNETTTETVTERHRYVAQIEVTGTQQELIPADERQQLEQDAANWSAWETGVHDVAGDDANVERQTQIAHDLLNVRNNPEMLITGKFWYVGVVLFGSFAGLTWVVLWLFYDWKKNREMAKKVNEIEALEVEEADLDEKLLEFDQEDRRRVLVNTDAHEWCDDEYAARGFIEAFGEDNLTSYLNFSMTISGGNILQDRLLAMGESDYWAAGIRDEDGNLIKARAMRPEHDESDLADGEEVVDLTEDAEAVADVIDPMDKVVYDFDLADCDVALRDESVELENPDDIDELIAELDADMQRFQGSEKGYVKYLGEMVEHVREHPFTDQHGRPKSQRYAMSMFLKKAQVFRDLFDMPTAELQADYLNRLLKEHDPVEDAEMVIEKDQRGETLNAD